MRTESISLTAHAAAWNAVVELAPCVGCAACRGSIEPAVDVTAGLYPAGDGPLTFACVCRSCGGVMLAAHLNGLPHFQPPDVEQWRRINRGIVGHYVATARRQTVLGGTCEAQGAGRETENIFAAAAEAKWRCAGCDSELCDSKLAAAPGVVLLALTAVGCGCGWLIVELLAAVVLRVGGWR